MKAASTFSGPVEIPGVHLIGQPPALRAWFYPDAQWGDEFAYGKKKAK
jgi:hypothetical protein